MCVNRQKVCDGQFDCQDRSDEDNCLQVCVFLTIKTHKGQGEGPSI